MTNLIGQSLGRYHILEQLGEGGMATVYKAYDTRLETDVAVKIIRTEKFTPEALSRALKRFEREAKSLARLMHPNIVKVTDYGEYEGRPYLVMPYLSGGTLKQKLKGKSIPWQEAVGILVPIARALAHAHQHGIVHRDVKPSNILITEEGEPMLSDFGVAKILESDETMELTGTGVGIGTPEYMAPEQFQGKRVDGRADIYALGVVFFEMLTGRKPYEADTPAAIIWKQASEPLPRPGRFTLGIPDKVEQIIVKVLAKDPKNRYQNMDEFALALQRLLLAAKPSPAREGKTAQINHVVQPASSPRSKSTTFQSNRVLWLIGAGGIVLLVMGLLFVRDSSVQNPGFSPLVFFAKPTATATATLTSTPTRTPTPTITLAPTPSATKFPTQTPYGQNLLPIKSMVRRTTFDSLPTFFYQRGKYSISNGVISLEEPLVSGDPWTDGESRLGYSPINSGYGYTLLFRYMKGAFFIIAFENYNFGTPDHRSFQLANGKSWDLWKGSTLFFSIPLTTIRVKDNTWYCLFMRLDSQGIIEARLWEKDIPGKIEKFRVETPDGWVIKPLNYYIGIGEGIIDVDYFEEVKMLTDEPLP